MKKNHVFRFLLFQVCKQPFGFFLSGRRIGIISVFNVILLVSFMKAPSRVTSRLINYEYSGNRFDRYTSWSIVSSLWKSEKSLINHSINGNCSYFVRNTNFAEAGDICHQYRDFEGVFRVSSSFTLSKAFFVVYECSVGVFLHLNGSCC